MRAIEAAARAYCEARHIDPDFVPSTGDAHDGRGPQPDVASPIWRWQKPAIEAAIRAYLTALAEDDAAVEKIKEAMLKERDNMTAVYGKDAGMFDLPTLYARAAIRAMGGE